MSMVKRVEDELKADASVDIMAASTAHTRGMSEKIWLADVCQVGEGLLIL